MDRGRGIDCHAHVIAPDRFPYADGPGYRPRPDEGGDHDAFSRALTSHGISHALLVQPSCYGYDNACMLDAMGRSRGRFRGIAVVAPSASDRELWSLKEQGVVGVRLNLMRSDPDALSRPDADRFLTRVNDLGWFLQIYARGDVWCGIERCLRQSRAKVIVDHFGEPDPARGVHQPGFQAVLGLGRDTGAVVKLSAPYRASGQAFPHADLEAFIGAAVGAFGLERCVWGSDWPFLNTAQPVEYDRLLELLGRWLPDPIDRDRVLWQNPVRLFGFAGDA